MSDKIRYVLTCGACPEQYDAYLGEECIGYLRLRHGHFYAEYLPTGEYVYTGNPVGDGIFDTDEERDQYLEMSAIALINRHQKDETKEKHFYIDGQKVDDWWGWGDSLDKDT